MSSEQSGGEITRSGGAQIIVDTKAEAYEAARRDETLLTRIRHYWCALGPGEYPEEREEPLITHDGEILGKRWVCSNCGQPVHFLAGPIEVET